MDCSLPGSSICGIFQARVLEWVAIAFSGEAPMFINIYLYIFICVYICIHMYLFSVYLGTEDSERYTFLHKGIISVFPYMHIMWKALVKLLNVEYRLLLLLLLLLLSHFSRVRLCATP